MKITGRDALSGVGGFLLGGPTALFGTGLKKLTTKDTGTLTHVGLTVLSALLSPLNPLAGAGAYLVASSREGEAAYGDKRSESAHQRYEG